MKRITGGTMVKPGFYWNPGTWEMATISGQAGALPGGPRERYVRVPVVTIVLVGPLMGGLFVIFLPFIGFAMVTRLLATKAVRAVRHGAREVAAAFAPAWRPGEAYLAGRPEPGEEAETEAPEKEQAPERLAALLEEIEARRERE